MVVLTESGLSVCVSMRVTESSLWSGDKGHVDNMTPLRVCVQGSQGSVCREPRSGTSSGDSLLCRGNESWKRHIFAHSYVPKTSGGLMCAVRGKMVELCPFACRSVVSCGVCVCVCVLCVRMFCTGACMALDW